MKLVQAIIKPLKMDEVKDSLNQIGIGGLTVTEVKGIGRQSGTAEMFVSARAGGGLPKVCLEIAVEDGKVERVIEAIRSAGRTDKVGDGKIFVYDIVDAVRIRTGERGKDSI
ncbi:MAG: P-II family nitrogen regulator [Nitrospinae bacterium]|nr:P-II family nitrogen regulator [Nitrospinota bacterium]